MVWPLAIQLLASCSFALPAAARYISPEQNPSNDEPTNDRRDDGCNTYMAVVPSPWSSMTMYPDENSDDEGAALLPWTGRWGLFAGRPYEQGDTIDIPHELSLPMADFGSLYLDSVNHLGEGHIEYDLAHACVSILYEYLWGGEHDSSTFDVPPEDQSLTLIPGIGLLTGLESKLHRSVNAVMRRNVRFDVLSVHKRQMAESVTPEQEGAFTTYFNMTLSVLDEEGVEAGAELVLPEMFDDEPGGDQGLEHDPEHILEEGHYEMLDAFIDQMQDFFMEKHGSDVESKSKQQMYEFLMSEYLEAGIGKQRKDYVSNHLLPDSLESFERLLLSYEEQLEGNDDEVYPPLLYGQPPSGDWLRANGFCIDSQSGVVPRPSGVPGAGHGAIAARSYAANERILVVPLLPIPNPQILDYFDTDANVVQKQILYNYCYGHPESNLLLLPLAPGANWINHSTGTSANAKLVWSSDTRLMKHQGILEQLDPYQILLDMFRPRAGPGMEANNIGFPAVGGLVMDIVATREIAKGEEVLLDYGDVWQAAWDANSNHASASARIGFRGAPQLNHEYSTKPFPTQDEDPIPQQVRLHAFVTGRQSRPEGLVVLDDVTYVVAVLSRRRKGASFVYTLLVPNPAFDSDDNEEEEEFLEVDDIPHDHLFFVPGESQPKSSNHFGSFRHYIAIPDDVFPRGKWRNNRQDQ